MRKLIGSAFLFAALGFLLTSGGYSQQRTKGGGFGKGGFGKGGFGKGGGMMGDPNKIFDFLAKDRGYFLISETNSLRQPLTEWAQAQGITDDKITKERYTAFNEHLKAKMGGGGNPAPFNRGAGPTKGGSTPAPSVVSPPPSTNQMEMWAEMDFKRHDSNSDGKLNNEEMPKDLLEDLARWDKNNDGLIDLPEYKAFFVARMQERFGANYNPSANPIATIIIEEEWDRRPTVLRAGKLHKDLPKWFAELDTNSDGQVSLSEWTKAGKDYELFQKYDRNDDGLLTQEEVLRFETLAKAKEKKDNPSVASTFGRGGSNPEANGDSKKKAGWGGFKKPK